MSEPTDSTGPARRVATRVLHRVASKGAWAAPTLDAEIRRDGLDARDAALASEIVYGTLRVLPSIDRAFEGHLRRGAHRLDPWARASLRAATYQLLHLSRVPARAVVHDAVSLVRAERGARLGGFVNAVLRRVAERRPDEPAPPTRLEVPSWLRDQLRAGLGDARTDAFLLARPLPPPLGLRARVAREPLMARLVEARPGARIEAGALAPAAVLVWQAGDPRKLPGYAEGELCVQEEGSQAVGLALGAQAGERVADACAGRGGKSLLLADAVGGAGQVTALDLDERKLDRLGAEMARLGLAEERVERAAVDLTVGAGGFESRFDRVLVDAPCSNLGTVHRRPELLLRAGVADAERLAETQLAILGQAARLVRPGGTLLYAVCSPTREEGPGVAERFEAGRRGVERLAGPLPGSGVPPDADGVARLGPWNDPEAGADAYQVVRWRIAATEA